MNTLLSIALTLTLASCGILSGTTKHERRTERAVRELTKLQIRYPELMDEITTSRTIRIPVESETGTLYSTPEITTPRIHPSNFGDTVTFTADETIDFAQLVIGDTGEVTLNYRTRTREHEAQVDVRQHVTAPRIVTQRPSFFHRAMFISGLIAWLLIVFYLIRKFTQ